MSYWNSLCICCGNKYSYYYNNQLHSSLYYLTRKTIAFKAVWVHNSSKMYVTISVKTVLNSTFDTSGFEVLKLVYFCCVRL